ncbi:MAG: HYC_CC_PP family protein [Bacteroidales bacterium]
MKKLISILFALIILLSGMNLSLAAHSCGGELSAIKVSFSHEKAGCGMCADEESIPSEKQLSTEGCCKDQISFLVVDHNYSPSSFEINKPELPLLQVFLIPSSVGICLSKSYSSLHTNVQPPGNFIASAVSLPDICVFRI